MTTLSTYCKGGILKPRKLAVQVLFGFLISLFLLNGVAIGSVAAETPQAKRVVCITGDGSGYSNNIEGYERILAKNAEKDKKQPQSTIKVGGKIKECLAEVANGDTLVMVAHGHKGGFTWNDDKETKKAYDTFAEVPLPNGFDKLTNVSVIFDACYSCTGGAIPAQVCMCDSLLKEMSQKKDNGNSCVGFKDVVDGSSLPNLSMKKGVKRDQEEIKAGYACIRADQSWMNLPPSNRPGAEQNQKTAAQAIVDDNKKCPGANGNLLVTHMTYGIPVEVIDKKSLKARACNQDPLDNSGYGMPSQDDLFRPAPEGVCAEASGCPECGNAVMLDSSDSGGHVDGPEPNPVHVGEVATIAIHGDERNAVSEQLSIAATSLNGSVRFTNGEISSNGAETTLSFNKDATGILEFVADEPGLSLLRLTVNSQTFEIYVRAIVP